MSENKNQIIPGDSETTTNVSLNPLVFLASCLFLAGLMFLVFSKSSGFASDTGMITTLLVSSTENPLRNNPAHVMGISAADCKKCHPSEVATWMKTVHYQTAESRLFMDEDNTEKYRKALNLESGDLLKNSACADCHGTKSIKDGQVKLISGVSCESCHGAAGGENGWLNRHQSYHQSKAITRAEETTEHRIMRQKHCDEAGMIRSDNIYGMAKKCFNCHIVGNEKLVAAGHKAASAFDYVSWSSGEISHNFLVDKNVNQDAPSLWLERTGGTAANRRRLKFVIGTLVQLETALRLRAKTTSPQYIPQLGGLAAAASGKLSQISAMAGTPELQAVVAVSSPLLGRLFVGMGDDEKVYQDAADQVAKQAKLFEKNHDGSQFQALDSLIQALPPYYSQHYKDKYGTP